MTKEEIGARIKARREYLRMTQEELAERFGVNQSALSQYEHGKRGLETTELARLAKILTVAVAYFYGEGEYHADDIPPDLKMVYEAQGRVYKDLPPGKARQQYIEGLRASADTLRAVIAARMETEGDDIKEDEDR